MLCTLAGQHHVQVTGNERAGSFRGRGGEGDYEFGEGCVRGNFSVHGVTGTFALATGKATVTVTDKPFWLPEVLLKQKIAAGLETFCNELV